MKVPLTCVRRKVLKKSGQLTVFFSLLLISIVSLLLVILESARTAGIRYNLSLAVNSSMESVFAGYQKELFDRYHLLFLWKSPESIKSEMEDYLSYYFYPSKGILLSGGNFYSMELKDIDIMEITTAIDKGGSIFEQAAVDSLGYEVLMSQADKLLGQWDVLKEGEDVYQDVHKEDEEIKEVLGDGTALMEEAEANEISSGFIEEFARTLGNLTWDVVDFLGEPASMKSIALSDLPTKEVVPDEENTGNLLKSCAFTIYIQKSFSCYTSETTEYTEKNGLNYEQEYILNGFSKDVDNLKATVGKLLILREGVNLIHNLNDGVKMAKAEGLALLSCSLLGVPQMAEVLKGFIIGIWSYEESVKDVQKLLKGEKVPILTNTDDGKEGLSYENYLELFLLIHNRQEKIYRAMDLIQINLNVNHPGFFLRDCIYELTLQVTVTDYRKRERSQTWIRNYY